MISLGAFCRSFKHGIFTKPLEFYSSIATLQSLQKQYKNYPKCHGQTKAAIAPSLPWIRHWLTAKQSFQLEMCGNDFRVPIPPHSNDFVTIPIHALVKSSNSHLLSRSNPESLPFPFPLKQEEFQSNARRSMIFVRMSTQNHSLL